MRKKLIREFSLLLTSLTVLYANAGEVDATIGPAETVLADNALGLRYFPDGRMAVLDSKPGCRVLIPAGVSTYMLEGPSLGRFTKATKVLDKGLTGEIDNGYAGINAAIRTQTGEILAFYHAEDQEGMRTVGNGIPGFYCRVALATSSDEGLTFQKHGAILTGQLSKDANGPGDQGVGEPWILAEPSGKFLYGYYTSHERVDDRGVQICVARCPVGEAKQPSAWKKFHRGSFSEPGIGGKDTPIVTAAQPEADAMCAQVVFVPALRQFAMTYCVNAWREGGDAKFSGLYLAFSDDGINWPNERRRQLWKVPVIARSGLEVAWHPTFILDGETSKNGWLYYAYSDNWGHTPPSKPHYLVRRRISLSTR